MHSLARLFCTASLFLMAGLSGSCAAPFAVTAGMAAAQAGSGAYTGGELRAARYATLDQTMEAVYATIDDLELEILTERTRTRSRYIMAKEQRGPEFKITIERKSRMATRIRIRVGIIGDVALSRLTMRRIDYHLAKIASWEEFDDPGNSEDETADVE
jgi:hypothetical protein